MLDKHKVVEEWSEWLSKEEWDLFVTITFRQSKAVFIALKLFKRFFKYLNNITKGFFSKYIKCWVYFEKDEDRKGVHIHSLVKGIHPSMAVALEQECNKFFGQSKVVPYDAEKGARYYLANKHRGPRLEHFDYYKINSAKR